MAGAHILADRLRQLDGLEYVVVSGSLNQGRIVKRFVAAELGDDWKWADSTTLVGGRHPDSGTRLRVMSSNPKTAFGFVGVPLVVADEPGSWEVEGGQMMYDALRTAQGKPGSPLQLILIGTLAPARGGWGDVPVAVEI